jgi:Lrp/AsnC family transcriptional regulator, regulator for asnA, asnC and gidA
MASDDTTGFAFGQDWLSEDVDELDRRIIARLQMDGRMPAKAIADEVSVSEVTVRKRLARLLDEKVIEVVAVPNALASDRTIMAMAQIRTSRDAEAVGGEIAEWPEAGWVAVGAGPMDLVVGLVCDGRKDFEDVLSRLHAVDGVADIQTFVYLKVLKQLYVGPLAPR